MHKKLPQITEGYSGYHNHYYLDVEGIGRVYTTKDRRDMKMFVAELKIRLKISENERS